MEENRWVLNASNGRTKYGPVPMANKLFSYRPSAFLLSTLLCFYHLVHTLKERTKAAIFSAVRGGGGGGVGGTLQFKNNENHKETV